MPDVLTMGSFDVLHPGHLGLFRHCREIARTGSVMVAVNSDEFMAKFKRLPIFSLVERMDMVSAVGAVDFVTSNDGEDQPELIRRLHPGVLVIGDDWAGKDYLAQIGLSGDRHFFANNNIELRYVPRTGDWSTTEIRERLLR